MIKKDILKAEIVIIVVAILLLIVPNLIGTKAVSSDTDKISTKTFDEIKKEKGKSIGCLLGVGVIEFIKKEMPDIDIRLFNTNEDVYQAVDSGVVDYGLGYAMTIEEIAKTYQSLKYIKEPISTAEQCFVLPKTEKGKKRLEELNTYIKEIKSNGTYEKLDKKWSSKKENDRHLEKYNLTGENGTLKFVTCGTWVPKSFMHDGEIVGVFIDMVYGYCEKYGYIPEIYTASYQAELAGIAVSEYDIMADIAERTDERERTVYLTEPVLSEGNILLIHEKAEKTTIVKKSDWFFKKIKEGFINNFIKDNRWKLIVEGLIATVILALASAFCGTILGAIICALRMNKKIYMTALARIYIKLIQSTPIVVLLMVLNYIVFNNTGLSAFFVSIIAFSIDFSAYVSEIFRSGIEAIDKGQTQAAKALGFTKDQIYKKIIIPQALIHILPVYSGQFISMVKLTSVAGYISVRDLTKMSDYIRSLTYEAFYPLISTAIIYFLLSALLVKLLRFFEDKIDLELHRKRVMKEVGKI